MIQTTTGRIMRSMRKDNNLTLAELSARCKVSVSYLSEIERDRANPTFSMLTSIFNSLGYSASFHFRPKDKE